MCARKSFKVCLIEHHALKAVTVVSLRSSCYTTGMFEFRLFRTPIRVQLWFFILAVFIGQGLMPADNALVAMAAWIAIVFIGVLAHEFGHALAGRMYGLVPEITLHGMGGVTSWAAGRRLSPQQNIVISVAGPAVGITLGTLALFIFGGSMFFVAAPGLVDLPREGRQLVQAWIWVNLGWGLLNLVPIVPLDGGHIVASLAHLVRGNAYRGQVAAHWVSLFVLAALGAYVLASPQWRSLWNLLLLGLLAWSNLAGLSALTRDNR